jgi:dGTPase
MTIRERTEQIERETLSPYAALSANTRGRRRPEAPCNVRTDYQRDRDRVIHSCKAFRRLAYKTQVFIAPRGDHFRTRLTHTLEVAQLARTVAKALRLNEELVEAIALAHDVGHTPFGHAGEWALDEIYRQYDPEAHFAHHEHSLRVVDELENDGAGLNLTAEVREGIVGHSKGGEDLAATLGRDPPLTLEALVVRVCDRVAYVNHDLDDALRAGLISPEQVPPSCADVLGTRHSRRVNTMVADLIENSVGQPRVAMGPRVLAAVDELKDFLYENVYATAGAPRTAGARPTAALAQLVAEAEKVRGVVHGQFRLYMESDEALHQAGGLVPTNPTVRARLVCDYVAGMTDRFAHEQYVRWFLPQGFGA